MRSSAAMDKKRIQEVPGRGKPTSQRDVDTASSSQSKQVKPKPPKTRETPFGIIGTQQKANKLLTETAT